MLVEAMNGLEIGSLGELDAILLRLREAGYAPLTIRLGTAAWWHLTDLAGATNTAITTYKHPVTGDAISLKLLALPLEFRRISRSGELSDVIDGSKIPAAWKERIEFHTEAPVG